MDLKSGYPYWAIKNGLMHAFPALEKDLRCDVLVIGGGITGALIANELSQHGHQVAVVEQRDIGWGSTSASTALLQYEIDTHMVDLARKFGEADAVLAYQACASAIPMLQRLCKPFKDVEFAPMRSLYYASKRRHVRDLREEFALRQQHGFKVSLLEREQVAEQFRFDAPLAILSELAARVDPYRLAYRLLARQEKRGVPVHDRTRVEHVEPGKRHVQVLTDQGHSIRARQVVMAAGYANQQWISQKVASNRSSYAFISDPVGSSRLGPLANTMVWESARPYLYMRSTADHRLLVGGDDDAVDVPSRRDARVEKKAGKLLRKVEKLFPELDINPAFSWAGTFAETSDGLPFFGPHQDTGPRVHYAMAYGGNGITYSMIGAGLLRALIERRTHPLAALFSFKRLQR